MTNPDDDRFHEERAATLQQVENLVNANAASNETMVRLVARVQDDAHLREKKVDLLEEGQTQMRRLLYMVAAVLVLMVGVGVINAVNIYDARKNAAVTAQTARDASSTYALLYDCLNQQGECGRKNAIAQKKLLDEVKLYELTVIFCVRTNPLVEDATGDKYLACVDRLYPGGPQLDRTP